MQAFPFPSFNRAFLGNNGFYTGVAGRPALYHLIGAGYNATNLQLSNIRVQPVGVSDNSGKVTGFSVVVADAESTDNGESVAWTHSGGTGFLWLPNAPASWSNAANTTAANTARKTAGVGNACNTTAVGDFPQNSNTTSPAASRSCSANSNQPATKNGTAMLQISPANTTSTFTVTQRMVGGGRQAVAFGVVLAGAKLNVQVDDRILNNAGNPTPGVFGGRLITPTYGDIDAQTTATSTSATTGEQSFPLSANGSMQLNFAATTTGDQELASYRARWACFKETSATATPIAWSGNTAGNAPPTDDAWFALKGGESIECTLTYTPPYLTLVKQVDKNGTAANDPVGNFRLTATGRTNPGPVSLVSGNGGTAAVTKRAVALGTYDLTESTSQVTWPYGYTWSDLVCRRTGTTSGNLATVTKDQTTSAVTSASVAVSEAERDITCTYSNKADQPRLVISKTASPASGTTIDGSTPTQSQVVTYTLIFDNTLGTAAIAANHVDHLRDVLDDAEFVAGSLRYGNGTGTPSATSPLSPGITAAVPNANGQMAITGTVPARQTRTISFQVQVKDNAENRATREGSSAPLKGYALRNYLTPAGQQPPATCAAPTGNALPTCTEHPVLAWTVQKDAQPLNGASLHIGGDVHYRIMLRKLNPDAKKAIEDVVITDDLTNVFRASRWYPEAPVPYPGQQRGIYFLDKDGNGVMPAGNTTNRLPDRPVSGGGLGATPDDVLAADVWVKPPVFVPNAGASACQPNLVPGPADGDCFRGTWSLETAAFDVPAEAARAEVWFSVRVGFAFDAQNYPVWNTAGAASGVTGDWLTYWRPVRQVQPGRTFDNTARVSAHAGVAPLACSADTGRPDGTACSTRHRVDANYFVIRKDLLHRDANGVLTRDINMVGHKFTLYMEHQGEVTPVQDILDWQRPVLDDQGNETGAFDTEPLMCDGWDDPDVQPEPGERCARFHEIASGSQAGRWRAERLPAGTYWLEETKAPTGVRVGPGEWDDLGAPNVVPIDGVQVLPERVKFRVSDGSADLEAQRWDAAADGYVSFHPSAGQLDVFTGGQAPSVYPRCAIPYGGQVSDLPTACINPTGYVMVLTDVMPQALPLTGGRGTGMLLAGGLVSSAAALCGTFWRRRRQRAAAATGGGPA